MAIIDEYNFYITEYPDIAELVNELEDALKSNIIETETSAVLYSEYKKLKEIVIKIKELEELICL